MSRTPTHPIEAELIGVTGLKRKITDNDQQWRQRLVLAYSELDEATFNALTAETYEWANNGAALMQNKQDIPAFSLEAEPEPAPEEEEAPAEEPEQDDAPADEAVDDEPAEEPAPAPRAKVGRPPAQKPAAPAPAPAPVKPKAPAPAVVKPAKKPRALVVSESGDLVVRHDALRATVLANSGKTDNEIMELARADGTDMLEASMRNVLYHTRHTLRILKDLFGIVLPDRVPATPAAASKPRSRVSAAG